MRVLAGLFAVLMAGLVLADEEVALPQHYMQEQEFFAGHWVGEGNIGDDPARIEFRARWAPGKHALVIHGTTRLGDKKAQPIRWSLLSGCEGETMVDYAFSSDGGSSITRWTTKSPKQQDGVEVRYEDGEQCTIDCQAVKDGKDKWTFTSETSDGKSIRVDYHRVDDLEAGLDDSLWREFCKRRVGTWDGEGAIRMDLEEFGLVKGDPFVYSIEWVPEMDGRALTGVGKLEVPSRGKKFEVRLLSGWDPEMRQIRVIAMWSGGLVEELLFSHRKGDTFFGTYTAKFPGRETERERIRLKYFDGDSSYAIDFLSGPLKGQPVSTWKRRE